MTDDTEITPTAEAPEVLTAWALDDEPIGANAPIVPSGTIERHGRLTTAGLAIVVAGVAAAGILLGATYLTWHASKPTEPVHVSAPTTITHPVPVFLTPMVPPPVTVTAAPPPSVPFNDGDGADRDTRFVALVHQNLPAAFYRYPVRLAQETCTEIGSGDRTKPKEVAVLVDNGVGTTEQVVYFVNTALAMYCPQYDR